jgi:hypothetical protein
MAYCHSKKLCIASESGVEVHWHVKKLTKYRIGALCIAMAGSYRPKAECRAEVFAK